MSDLTDLPPGFLDGSANMRPDPFAADDTPGLLRRLVDAIEGLNGHNARQSRPRIPAARAFEDVPLVGVDISGNGGLVQSSGPMVLDLGGPDLGYRWTVRRLNVGGVTPTTTAAGRADIYIAAVPPSTTSMRSLLNWVDQAATLPSAAGYGDRQLIVPGGVNLYAVFSNCTTGQQYVAVGLAEQYEDRNYAATADV